MKIIKPVTKSIIESHLIEVGDGNQKDNFEQISIYQNYYLAQLTKEDFLSLVFLEIEPTKALIKKANSRQLAKIAVAANNENLQYLGPNWDLSKIILNTEKLVQSKNGFDLPALLIRPSRNGELSFGAWYLQDGSHRSLGYAMKIVSNLLEYRPIKTYLVTNEILNK